MIYKINIYLVISDGIVIGIVTVIVILNKHMKIKIYDKKDRTGHKIIQYNII
jgi:hypothetical protein